MTGNEAVVKGAIRAGAKIMCGYPITPATEILQEWSKIAEVNKNIKIIQSEDEISAGFNVIGAIIAGSKAFSASAGPGHILMQDSLSMAEAMRLPFVGVMMMRGGPSTGTVIYGQQELNLACYGGNGEGHRIVYSASSPQELFEYTIKSFYSAWKYRFPTILLGDGYISKMSTEVNININFDICSSEPILNHKHFNMRNCFNIEEELANNIMINDRDYHNIIPKVVESEQYKIADANKVIIAHGIVANAARDAVDTLRHRGKKVGLFRPISIKPMDFVTLSRIASRVDEILIAESSLGHLERIIKSGIYGLVRIKTIQKPAQLVSPEEMIKKI